MLVRTTVTGGNPFLLFTMSLSGSRRERSTVCWARRVVARRLFFVVLSVVFNWIGAKWRSWALDREVEVIKFREETWDSCLKKRPFTKNSRFPRFSITSVIFITWNEERFSPENNFSSPFSIYLHDQNESLNWGSFSLSSWDSTPWFSVVVNNVECR